jgi:hypothetical protein
VCRLVYISVAVFNHAKHCSKSVIILLWKLRSPECQTCALYRTVVIAIPKVTRLLCRYKRRSFCTITSTLHITLTTVSLLKRENSLCYASKDVHVIHMSCASCRYV